MPVALALIAIAQVSCALPETSRAHVDQAWRLADKIRGRSSSVLHQEIFGAGPLDGSAYRRFFDQRVRSIQEEGIFFASCHGAFACYEGRGLVRLSKKFAEMEIPPVIRLSLLVHEARHADGFGHETCPDPFAGEDGRELKSFYDRVPLAGKPACETSSQGSYATQWVMLKNIERFCDSCDPETRKAAADFSAYLLQLIRSPSARAELLADTSPNSL